MQLPDLKNIFAKKQFMSKPHRPKKSVSFSPDTSFEPGRALQQWKRHSPTYLAAKYRCPPDLGGWLDTSLMSNDLEQLLNLKVHAIFHVRDADEIAALHNSFHAQMQACLPLLPGLETLLRDHPLLEEVLGIYEYMTANGVTLSDVTGEDWRRAKVLILVEDQSDKSITFQFVNDAQEDLEAHEHILELRRTVPATNVGIPSTDRLRQLRYEWLAEACGPSAHMQ
jgi:DNA-binding ferritin-like protein (Dps family)